MFDLGMPEIEFDTHSKIRCASGMEQMRFLGGVSVDKFEGGQCNRITLSKSMRAIFTT